MIVNEFKPYIPGQPITEPADLPDLYQTCQQASYPITFEWPGGERITYNTPEEAYQDLWARLMLTEAQALGGIIPNS